GFAAGPTYAVPMMLLITLLMGLIQVFAGMLRLGVFGRYVSHAVLIGFTLGAATLIFADQLRNVLGLPVNPSPRLVETLEGLVPHVAAADLRAVAIAIVTWVIVLASARISRLIPGAMVAIACTALGAWALGWEEGISPIRVVGEVPAALPHLTLPPLSIEHLRLVMTASPAVAPLAVVE